LHLLNYLSEDNNPSAYSGVEKDTRN